MKLIKISLIIMSLFLFCKPGPGYGEPVNFTDADGHKIIIEKSPARVVSLVPSITEILFEIGAENAVKGVTYHDTYPPKAAQTQVIGGFFKPNLEKIHQADPEIIFISDLHNEVAEKFSASAQLIRLDWKNADGLYENIHMLGQIFDKKPQADALIKKIKNSLNTLAKKISKIPLSERKRVVRLMGRDSIMSPGDDSFQNEYIRLAGGIPPKWNKNGKIVPITQEEWTRFNPQIIYACGMDKTAETLLNRPGWKDVDAVKNKKILYFPCELTCRFATRASAFASRLASCIYEDFFQSPVLPDQIKNSKPINIDLPYVESAKIIHASVYDFIHKTLMLKFKEPMAVNSTLEGFRENVSFAGNSFSPPQCWGIYHHIGLNASQDKLLSVLNKTRKNTSLLFTGADMGHLSVQKQTFKDMTVYALVTAGVKSNAVRMSQDIGMYYEPGTINILILSNMKLSARAMSRSIISATEGKTAALWDMDIRSSYTPLINPATGTGTDNMIVVQGNGTPIDNAGGHSKMGELIAKAVYDGVKQAVYKQNGLKAKRNIFQRLDERHIFISRLTKNFHSQAKLEALLLTPKISGFIESALVLSDAYERGLIKDLSAFEIWCNQISENKIISGNYVQIKNLPKVLKMAFNAVLARISNQENQK